MKQFVMAALIAWAAEVVAAELVVATVNNGHMITMQRLSPHFERQHPGIEIRWVTLEEGQLRQQVTRDITAKGGRFDVTTIGLLEAPIWGRRGWLKLIAVDASYDMNDLLPSVRQGLSVNGRLVAAPFYGESSMTMARSDLLQAKGLKLPARPTWAQIKALAEQLHDPDKGVHGICLRGKAGWGENMALIGTMVNAFGGQWFDMGWRAQLTTPPWRNAVGLYVDLLKRFGPPGAVANGYNENLALFRDGKCALWVDATVAGPFLNDPKLSTVAGKVQFAQAPTAVTAKGSRWLWAWALAIPASTSQGAAAQAFVKWATSKEYVRLAAKEEGWGAVPSGVRQSTYAQRPFLAANPAAQVEREAMALADPLDPTVPRSPYIGIQYVGIPEFQSIGTAVGQEISRLLVDGGEVLPALERARRAADRKIVESGYRH